MSNKAIIELQGQQFSVESGSKIVVNSIAADPGSVVTIDSVLWVQADGKTLVGTPHVQAKVQGRILEHRRGRKVSVRTYRRRQGYRRHIGHRQHQSVVQIESIGA